MVKRKNKISRGHKYGDGDLLENILGAAGTGVSMLSGVFNTGKGIDTTSYEDKIKAYGNQQISAADNQGIMDIWSNRQYYDNIDKYDVTGGNPTKDVLGIFGSLASAGTQGALAGSKIGGPVGAAIGAGVGLVTDSIGHIVGAINTNKKLERLNEMAKVANARYNTSFDLAIENAEKNKLKNSLSTSYAFGGPFFGTPTINGAASYDIAKDDAYTKQLKAQSKNSTSFNPIFFSDGGMLMSDNFTNGVTTINKGGTHENNYHEGVPVGIAPDGKPNLVEEGEAIFNDYVFSNRLKVPKEVRNKYKLRGTTFAEVFKYAQKESEERPNDPKSQNYLESIAEVLARTQEAIKGYDKATRVDSHKAAVGGHLFAGPWESWINNNPELIELANRAAESLNKKEEIAQEPPVTKNKINTSSTDKPKSDNPKDINTDESSIFNNFGDLRYVEPFANLGVVASDLLGLTNTPTRFEYVPGFNEVSYNPLGNYAPVKHFNSRYGLTQLGQMAGNTTNAIMQSTAPNRDALLLAADYNAQNNAGKMLLDADFQDYNRELNRLSYNKSIDEANSRMGLQTALANQEARLKYGQAALQQAKMSDDASNLASAAKAQNFGTLLESVANIGRESDAIGWRDMLLKDDVYGTQTVANLRAAGWDDTRIRNYYKEKGLSDDDITALGIKACGGKISRKK